MLDGILNQKQIEMIDALQIVESKMYESANKMQHSVDAIMDTFNREMRLHRNLTRELFNEYVKVVAENITDIVDLEEEHVESISEDTEDDQEALEFDTETSDMPGVKKKIKNRDSFRFIRWTPEARESLNRAAENGLTMDEIYAKGKSSGDIHTPLAIDSQLRLLDWSIPYPKDGEPRKPVRKKQLTTPHVVG